MPGFGRHRPSGSRHKWGRKQPTQGRWAPQQPTSNPYDSWSEDIYIFLVTPMNDIKDTKDVVGPAGWTRVITGSNRNYKYATYAMGYQIDTRGEVFKELKKLYAESKKNGNLKTFIKVWIPAKAMTLDGETTVGIFNAKYTNGDLKAIGVLP